MRYLAWCGGVVLGLSLAGGTEARADCENDRLARLVADKGETADYRIDVDFIPAPVIDLDIRRFRPTLRPSLAYTAYGLTTRAAGGQSTVLVEVDGDRVSTVVALDQTEDRGESLLFVAVAREKPTVGATDGPWITTYVFRAAPFELLWEVDGLALKATAADQKPLPPMQRSFVERFLVLCFSGRGDAAPTFGLIDRTLLYHRG